MLRQRFRWPIIIVPRSGEDTRSRSRLTGEPREWYVQILGKEPLIRHKCGNRRRWAIFRSTATSIQGHNPSNRRILAQNDHHL